MIKSLLFLNGTLAPFFDLDLFARFKHGAGKTVIAADGGALKKLLKAGIFPKKVIGDGDSFCVYPEGLKIEKQENQESTDFEKCLQYIMVQNLSPTLVCGIGGGELDHQHNNLHSFVSYAKNMPMIFLDTQIGVSPKIGVSIYVDAYIKARPGATLSLFGFPSARLSTRGLVWPLCREVLALGQRSGARNRVSAEDVCVTVEDGVCLLMMNFEDMISLTVDGCAFVL